MHGDGFTSYPLLVKNLTLQYISVAIFHHPLFLSLKNFHFLPLVDNRHTFKPTSYFQTYQVIEVTRMRSLILLVALFTLVQCGLTSTDCPLNGELAVYQASGITNISRGYIGPR